ncbi:hypothetical protein EDEG_03960 [Edhazardia aedis USNM 41457]|uniref:Uncharacterized protein n=1 Tax=Edhazardia aedis (strain USNM 41457) TaxID=1003232 RepID=J9DFP1_EDHAE|nr:hypothetical protein EDEG_03960 [Edhazardia aedis USNM 41457]|eukprot:EJW01420.1 hypothetical protein EDEG_03960 [Edhazardia aedis USNM 41457]
MYLKKYIEKDVEYQFLLLNDKKDIGFSDMIEFICDFGVTNNNSVIFLENGFVKFYRDFVKLRKPDNFLKLVYIKCNKGSNICGCNTNINSIIFDDKSSSIDKKGINIDSSIIDYKSYGFNGNTFDKNKEFNIISSKNNEISRSENKSEYKQYNTRNNVSNTYCINNQILFEKDNSFLDTYSFDFNREYDKSNLKLDLNKKYILTEKLNKNTSVFESNCSTMIFDLTFKEKSDKNEYTIMEEGFLKSNNTKSSSFEHQKLKNIDNNDDNTNNNKSNNSNKNIYCKKSISDYKNNCNNTRNDLIKRYISNKFENTYHYSNISVLDPNNSLDFLSESMCDKESLNIDNTGGIIINKKYKNNITIDITNIIDNFSNSIETTQNLDLINIFNIPEGNNLNRSTSIRNIIKKDRNIALNCNKNTNEFILTPPKTPNNEEYNTKNTKNSYIQQKKTNKCQITSTKIFNALKNAIPSVFNKNFIKKRNKQLFLMKDFYSIYNSAVKILGKEEVESLNLLDLFNLNKNCTITVNNNNIINTENSDKNDKYTITNQGNCNVNYKNQYIESNNINNIYNGNKNIDNKNINLEVYTPIKKNHNHSYDIIDSEIVLSSDSDFFECEWKESPD